MGYTGTIRWSPPDTGWSKWDPATGNSAKRYAAIQPDANGKNPRVKGGYMRAFLLFSTFDPMQGYAPKSAPGYSDPKLSIECQWPLGDWSVHVDLTNSDYKMGFLPSGLLAGAPPLDYGQSLRGQLLGWAPCRRV